MSKVLDKINYQIKRDGNLPEHLEVLKLYQIMIKHPSLNSNMMWSLVTSWNPKTSTYSINPEFKQLLQEFNC